jgi:hypothetical protein
MGHICVLQPHLSDRIRGNGTSKQEGNVVVLVVPVVVMTLGWNNLYRCCNCIIF